MPLRPLEKEREHFSSNALPFAERKSIVSVAMRYASAWCLRRVEELLHRDDDVGALLLGSVGAACLLSGGEGRRRAEGDGGCC